MFFQCSFSEDKPDIVSQSSSSAGLCSSSWPSYSMPGSPDLQDRRTGHRGWAQLSPSPKAKTKVLHKIPRTQDWTWPDVGDLV